MEVTTRKRLLTDGLVTNLGPDVLWVGDKNVEVDEGYPLALDASLSVTGTEFLYGVSEGTSEIVRLAGGTGVFPKGVDAPDLSGYQPLDSDLTAIAALTTTSYGRAMLTLADAAALGALLGSAVYGQAQPVNAQTGTTYTLVAGDAGKRVTLSNAAGITLTLPQDSDATIAIGTYVDGIQLGAGQVTVAAGSGATLRTSGLTAKARAQYSRFGIQKILANTWSLFGDLASF